MNGEKKRLCLVIHSLQVGGMERVMSELADYFCGKKDVEVHLVLYGRNPELFYKVQANLIIHKPATKFNNRIRQISTIKRLLYLRRTIARIKPDSILSFGEVFNSFVLLALLGLPFHVFISDRCSPERKFSILNTLLRRILYPGAKGIIAQTEKAKQLYTSQFKNKKIHVIGNPIRKTDTERPGIERENIVLTVGRLIQSKHHDKLIELFEDLSIPGWRLVIVGDDALMQNNAERLKKLVQKLNAQDRIILAGKQADVESYYLRSKILVLTSSSEGFPNVIGEAMMAGLPVVAFDCIAGPSELITNNENGFLVPLFDFEGIKEKLSLLMMDEQLRIKLGNNAPAAVKRFSTEIIGDKYYSVLIN